MGLIAGAKVKAGEAGIFKDTHNKASVCMRGAKDEQVGLMNLLELLHAGVHVAHGAALEVEIGIAATGGKHQD